MIQKILYRIFIYLRSFNLRVKSFSMGDWIPISTTIISHPGSSFILESGVKIGRFVTITTLPKSRLIIKKNSIVNHLCTIYCAGEISIGENTRIAHGVTLVDHDYSYKEDMSFDKKEIINITIGENVWIGAGSILLKGTEIGNNSVVAAASLIKGKYKNKAQIIFNEVIVKIKKI